MGEEVNCLPVRRSEEIVHVCQRVNPAVPRHEREKRRRHGSLVWIVRHVVVPITALIEKGIVQITHR